MADQRKVAFTLFHWMPNQFSCQQASDAPTRVSETIEFLIVLNHYEYRRLPGAFTKFVRSENRAEILSL